MMEDEMVGQHHQINGHEFEQTPGDSEGQGSLVSFSPWGCKESDTTERLNSNNNHLGCIQLGTAFPIKVLFFFTEVTYFPIKRQEETCLYFEKENKFRNLLVYLFNNYLLNSYCVPGTMPSSTKVVLKVWSVGLLGSFRPFNG